jgi:flagellar hook-basal body complex protein FliE
MPGPISPISSIPNLAAIQPLGQSSQPGAFQSVLNGAIQTIQSTSNDASVAVQKFLTGENEELHTAALAVQKANITFDLGMAVRNKVVDAYTQIMQMQM